MSLGMDEMEFTEAESYMLDVISTYEEYTSVEDDDFDDEE